MGKHAFLIMAHKDDLSYRTLLKQLDNERSEIFIHMDSKNKNYNPEDINILIKKSKVFHVKRTNVTWGGFSQISCEVLLLSEATKTSKYDYYHLLSGQDLLINYIENLYDFFEVHNGKEFIRFQDEQFNFGDRVNYYSIQEIVGRKKNLLYYLDRFSKRIQKNLGLRRNVNVEFQKGTNWFSITDDLARFVVLKEAWINKTFKYTFCADEIFLQTIVHNSKFKENLFNTKYNNGADSILRLIDWERGNPYVFKNKDFQEIVKSDMFFARKFDENVDSKIIDRIYDFYKS